MPNYRLTYFNVTSRAEVARLLFAAANVDFEDVRIARAAWPDLKPTTPFGQIPMLEVDGKPMCQSMVIARYLAKQFGMAGKGDCEETRADMIAHCAEDILRPIQIIRNENQDDLKQEKIRAYEEEQLPSNMAFFEKLLKENNGGNGYFVGDGMTYADIAVAHYIYWATNNIFMRKLTLDFSRFPKCEALIERVKSSPGIAKYLAKRPKDTLP